MDHEVFYTSVVCYKVEKYTKKQENPVSFGKAA